MKVKIDRIRMGAYLPGAKNILARMSYLPQTKCDAIVEDISFRNIPITLALRPPFAGPDWEAFQTTFEFNQVPQGPAGTAKHLLEPIPADYDTYEDDSDEEDETSMQLFCIKTESRKGNKYEILVLATTEEIALKHSIRDPAVVKSISVVPGPFSNGTVLSTKLIT